MDESDVIDRVRDLKIETPSWGYGDSGTRFKTFPWPGAARDVWEKIDDASVVNRLTGAAPSVALHIPWDKVDDYAELRRYAQDRGLRIGAINPNLFQEDCYRLGSLCNPDPAVREKAIQHVIDCIEICKKTGSKVLSLWLADGTNYFGQDSLMRRRRLLEEGLEKIYTHLPGDVRLLLEYKFYEPAFYHTDVPDWGTSYILCRKLGSKAKVLVDTGHHALATNVEQIVSTLLQEGALGGFHFNSRNYGDDDLVVGTADPFQLFRIFFQITEAEMSGDAIASNCAREIAYMIDQSHVIEDKIEAMILSVVNCQEALAKALMVDRDALERFQRKGDVLGAHEVVRKAFLTDVRPILEDMREEDGLPLDPIQAYRESGYADRIAKERGRSKSRGSGYPE